MNDVKHWYLSKTVWGGLLAVAAFALQLKGFQLDPTDQSAIADSIVSITGAVGGILAIYGRVIATAAIRIS
ncbi:hypothetical protein [Rhizobium tubonense]|uniref:Uncharacterized protein n=1 Tax=Rhizobium tubonense TaxID=484088 RepID=A0A2W4CWR6_9HYPH|nr:hypothetical protein [Rhizobium tubonense]PZM17077.1 hypothetical protein CPY51_02240 [Rhizobium tubonense]